MPNYGFLIDLRKCIGCHACTIACKAEHAVPIGVNRCWVKTVERGVFPETTRQFFPVLCNQCEDAPCVRICPTNALFRRLDGIVDLHADSCIGCRSCMQACPYDQLFIDPGTRTAEKCNFCANRVENELLPACVSVCPTQCRIFGDLEDAGSEVSRLIAANAVTVRKPEKNTGPKIFYIGADDSVLRPEVAVRPLIYKEGEVTLRPLATPMDPPVTAGDPRVDYDVPHAKPWGIDLVAYLVAKGISTGAMFLSAMLWWLGERGILIELVGPLAAIVFAALTGAVLIADLERPERFYYILTRPNWRSWLVWGAWFLTAHGALASLWVVAWAGGLDALRAWLVAPTLLVAILATAYTSFLFAQGLGRDLWQGPISAVDLLALAAAEGSAVLLLAALMGPAQPGIVTLALQGTLLGALAVHLAVLVVEHLLSPSPSRHHALAVQSMTSGPLATWFWGGAVLLGGLVPVICLVAAAWRAGGGQLLPPVAAALALAGALVWEYVWVEAGQSVPLS
jgi:Fe-S-cluster-containing dehydrogenase component/formate-dependent nitrite reductase membrane component NrfD